MERYVLSLGSNVGSRLQNILCACNFLKEWGEILAVSKLYLTEPVGPLQPYFLNMSILFLTYLEPEEMLVCAKNVERKLGRRYLFDKGPREIDVDIILWSGGKFVSERLIIPHPEYNKRAFVLQSLFEIPLNGFFINTEELRIAFENCGFQRIFPLEIGSFFVKYKLNLGG